MAAAAALRGGGRAVTREVLQLEARGLCTKPVGTGTAPPPPPKNVAAPQGSTELLAVKAPVEFRKMLSSSSLLLSADKGESISSTTLKEAAKPAEDTRMPTSRKTEVAFPQRGVASSREEENLTTPARGGGLRKKLAEEQTSSSSESDSSSDSEDENVDDSEVVIKTKVEFPRRYPIISENIAVKASLLTKEKLSQKSLKEYGIKKLPRKPEIDVSSVKQVKFSKTSVSQETSKSRARDPKVKSPPKEQKLVLEPHVVKSLDLTNITRKSDHVEEKSTGPQVAAVQLKTSAVTQEDKKQDLLSGGGKEKMKEAQELQAKEATAPKVEETSGSTTLVMGTTAKEKTTQEAGVQAGESSTIEETAQPAPEEFDNSTYKNLQHHEYHTFTFHDYVAVLAKYRQPQPSSGRPSPRH
ncbi:NADH dehydrogenase [ubiquinone] flavoprotein 3, mitochondrial isoform X1 [Onychostruthus taczanowskii]|uniref:NADH dehydrogenase [ubiquinone] flavoprotein 3, mitochondrial isoform X1 n=2 Tax=Onychostruthus taczanowskii TaxID=356909 RepID=UPI001B809DCA|nr:NADH dehydrogenase [ubiquinone] flavoprotein 3, mitochondrial isoform X1 [Onychostruthus taczanowskii]